MHIIQKYLQFIWLLPCFSIFFSTMHLTTIVAILMLSVAAAANQIMAEDTQVVKPAHPAAEGDIAHDGVQR
jgi:hypothetical protein